MGGLPGLRGGLPGGGGNFVANKFRRGQISGRKNLVGFLKTARKILGEFLVTKFVHRNFSKAKSPPPGTGNNAVFLRDGLPLTGPLGLCRDALLVV
jgi:hypothetical protein